MAGENDLDEPGQGPSQGETDDQTSSPPATKGFLGRRKLSSLASFVMLPYELRARIITIACGSPALPRNTPVGRSTDCTSTMLSLLTTARVFYPAVIPFLYAHVRLPRPSNLRSFQQALASRPSLGLLVKSLHVGEDQPLPEHWFPLRTSGCSGHDHGLLRLNLASALEPTSWRDCPVQEHDLHHFQRDDAKHVALHAAIEAASEALNVNARRRNYSLCGRFLPTDKWYIRLFELQAGMEIYLLDLKRRRTKAAEPLRKTAEDPDPRKRAKVDCDARILYPALRVGTTPLPPLVEESGDRSELVVYRSQLLDRMASPGAPTDSFNHPVLFARSGLAWHAIGSDREHHRGSMAAEDGDHRVNLVPDVFDTAHFDRPSGRLEKLASNRDFLNLGLPNTATVGGCLSLARCVFAQTPNVTNLSVTGFFERAVAGQQPPVPLSLQSLSMGPCPLDSSFPRNLTHPALRSIERLRLCGPVSAGEEGRSLSGDDGSLPSLSAVDWIMIEEFQERNEGAIAELIEQLVGLDSSTEAIDGEQRPLQPSARLGPTLFQAQLHPGDVRRILAAAPSEDVAKAWRSGMAVRGIQHRLRLLPLAYPENDPGFVPRWSDRDAQQGLYDQGKEWWEES